MELVIDMIVCQSPGCQEEAIECRIKPGSVVDDHLCPQHASEAGYCACCGDFWAGVNSFDFAKSGLCEHCEAELEAESEEIDDDDIDDDTDDFDDDDMDDDFIDDEEEDL